MDRNFKFVYNECKTCYLKWIAICVVMDQFLYNWKSFSDILYFLRDMFKQVNRIALFMYFCGILEVIFIDSIYKYGYHLRLDKISILKHDRIKGINLIFDTTTFVWYYDHYYYLHFVRQCRMQTIRPHPS